MKEKIIKFVGDVIKEMKKVSWPTQEDLKESTKIVVVVCLIFALFTYIVDMGVTNLFKLIFK
ncbi:MAG TPA: preprotein translocase subunit SecE [Ignavibacteriales bacterium]|nr:preprotein translocase subunit SecE [Ignavibacteriales bacterium]HOL81954.1 preprotein translocase subunit SecE [Ignavibacteriales bacterium]HOM65002.1 preprotein translocase subunit SecE [Ignavibacteriales bacterium]HPD67266.1 preprotein translocase subunit SecE [Ignavibacteriales bacterium]HPP34091.1 preprotein translocase subunit SecE [Ignavibacteriales bacterium]